MLEVRSDLVASPQVEKEGQWVDVGSSAQEHSHLGGTEVKERTTAQRSTSELKRSSSQLPILNQLELPPQYFWQWWDMFLFRPCDALAGFAHERQRENKGYKSSDDEHGVEDVVLEGEQGQTHVGEDEVLRQEVQQFKELQHNQ